MNMNKQNFKVVNIQNYKQCINQVADWIYNEFIKGHIPDCSHSDLVSSIEDRKVSKIPMTLICLKDDKCIGTISIFSNDLCKLQQFTPWLAALYVDEKYRKQGVAKILMAEVENIVLKLGYSKLYLRTETAGEYYSKLGWNKFIDITDENGIFTSVYEKVI